MITSQRGHGITLKGQDLKCSCEGQRQRQRRKSTNLMLLHLSQLGSHKDIYKKKKFKPPSILVHQPIRILHYHTLRPEIRSPSPSLYLGQHPMVIQIWKKKDLLVEADFRFRNIFSRSVSLFLMAAPSFSIRISLYDPSKSAKLLPVTK